MDINTGINRLIAPSANPQHLVTFDEVNGLIPPGIVMNYTFDTVVERDTYFTTHGSELVAGIWCLVKDVPEFDYYDGTVWRTPQLNLIQSNWGQIAGSINNQTDLQNLLNLKAPSEKGIPDGGATGQVLAKQSNANNDVTWVNQSGGGGGIAQVSDLDTYLDSIPGTPFTKSLKLDQQPSPMAIMYSDSELTGLRSVTSIVGSIVQLANPQTIPTNDCYIWAIDNQGQNPVKLGRAYNESGTPLDTSTDFRMAWAETANQWTLPNSDWDTWLASHASDSMIFVIAPNNWDGLLSSVVVELDPANLSNIEFAGEFQYPQASQGLIDRIKFATYPVNDGYIPNYGYEGVKNLEITDKLGNTQYLGGFALPGGVGYYGIYESNSDFLNPHSLPVGTAHLYIHTDSAINVPLQIDWQSSMKNIKLVVIAAVQQATLDLSSINLGTVTIPANTTKKFIGDGETWIPFEVPSTTAYVPIVSPDSKGQIWNNSGHQRITQNNGDYETTLRNDNGGTATTAYLTQYVTDKATPKTSEVTQLVDKYTAGLYAPDVANATTISELSIEADRIRSLIDKSSVSTYIRLDNDNTVGDSKIVLGVDFNGIGSSSVDLSITPTSAFLNATTPTVIANLSDNELMNKARTALYAYIDNEVAV